MLASRATRGVGRELLISGTGLRRMMAQRTLDAFFKRPREGPASASDEKRTKLENDGAGGEVEGLTEAQKERIERNRQAAAAKLDQKRVHAPLASETITTWGQKATSRLGEVLDPSWRTALSAYLASARFKKIAEFVEEERRTKRVFPAEPDVFSAFRASPFEKIKVVVIGQDPYHGEGQAHGLSFSVRRGKAVPPSLQNIYTELESDIPGFSRPGHGCLQQWADQGVLLLNAVLTVEAHKAASHQGKGWEEFTDQVIEQISAGRRNVVFLLWGRAAQMKGKKIDRKKHHVLTASHPSPMSSNRGGWFGCKHFSQANKALVAAGKPPVDWQL